MSILIKDMKMPRDCEECRFSEVIDGLGCMITHYLILRRHGQDKPNWCPLVEVPPHGRLIDADKLCLHLADYQFQEAPSHYGNADAYYAIEDCIEAIKHSHTIIEAEDEKLK